MNEREAAETNAKIERLMDTIAEQRAEIDLLRAFVADQPCECYDEYGKWKTELCDRCKLLQGQAASPAGGKS